jgi:hypothetical protein
LKNIGSARLYRPGVREDELDMNTHLDLGGEETQAYA